MNPPSDPSGLARTNLYSGLFAWHTDQNGEPRVSRHASPPAGIPCPATGRLLRVATVDAESPAICPRCTTLGHGGFVSFVGDLRMAYACPVCRELVWLPGV
jgi:uncharacterized paraquat-inducible protein A